MRNKMYFLVRKVLLKYFVHRFQNEKTIRVPKISNGKFLFMCVSDNICESFHILQVTTHIVCVFIFNKITIHLDKKNYKKNY